MADAIEQRDFFISFNSADLAYAEAIDAALRAAGFTTYYHPTDIPPGGNIPLWMEDALMNSRQLLALCSPEYMADGAVYSEAERYARFWQDSRSAKFKLVPVELKPTSFKPLMSVYKRIDAKNTSPAQAAAAVVGALKKPDEVQQREVIYNVEPLPKIFNVLYHHNPNFTGRFEAMESLQKSLREGNAAITAVAGMGGVGKTTLAAEYCHRFGGRYGGVWWVRAEQEPVMLADLAALGQRLGLAVSGNIEADARAALEDVASRTEPWLMVYDNAPYADVIRKWLPAGRVRCLITSRFAAFDSVATVTRLDQWSDDVTADYLLARTGRNEKEGALRLAHSLGGLPLAAEQAAVFLKDRKGISFDDYAKEIARLIKEEKPTGAKGDYPDTVYAAFVKSLGTLSDMQGGVTALNLLRLCAFLSPDGVDLELLLVNKYSIFLPRDFASAVADIFAREDALSALMSLSLLRQDDGPMGRVLVFHRLLLEVVRDWMGVEDRSFWGSAAAQLVNLAFPDEPGLTPSLWQACSRLMLHVAPLQANSPHSGTADKNLDRLLNQASLYLAARGDRAGALAMAIGSVELARLTENNDPLGLAVSLNNLGGRYAELDRLDEAETTLLEALAIKEARLQPNDPNLAFTLANIAHMQWRRKEFHKAEPLFLRAAEIFKIANGAESGEYGSVLTNLDTLYDDWAEVSGDVEKRRIAEEYSTKALAIAKNARGTRHPHTAYRYHNLAVLKDRLGDHLGAALGSERAVAIMMSLDLAQHPDTQFMIGQLARSWERDNRTDAARQLRRGDMSRLAPAITAIEAEHRAWVAEDPEHRHFGPPSPFAKS
jgi:tetratricopeptide (TPR) repeat protein